MELSKTNVINMLQTGIVNVKFTKTDGSEREMKCTLLESIAIPHVKKTDREKKINDNIISVWDVDKQDWRSFRFDSIISIYK
jgi:mannitol/fructose-specific phosphotransferase system IIA component